MRKTQTERLKKRGLRFVEDNKEIASHFRGLIKAMRVGRLTSEQNEKNVDKIVRAKKELRIESSRFVVLIDS